MTNRGRQGFVKVVGAALAAMLVLGACGGGDDDDAKKDKSEKQDTSSSATTKKPTQNAAAGSSYFATATAAKVDVYDSQDGTTATKSYDKPTDAGKPPLVFLVDGTDVSGQRLHVHLPDKPNGSEGWIDKSQVQVTQNPFSIKIELAAHKLTLTKSGQVVLDTSVGLGKEGLETPVGTFFLTQLYKNPNPSNAYGPYAYGTSAYSTSTDPAFLKQFPGGQIGIHGNNDPSSIGANKSHGCVRLPNDKITEMANMLPLGTPVEVVA